MIGGSEKRNRQLAFELQNLHVCEKRSKVQKAGVLCKSPHKRTSAHVKYRRCRLFQ